MDSKKKKFKTQTKGLVIVYTGEGKGKTTAALGLALRASGHGQKVLIVQFGKAWFTGESKALEKLHPLVKIVQGGKGFVKILGDKLPLSEHKKAAHKTFNYLYQEMISGKWDVIVADEILGAISSGLLSISQGLKLIQDKPKSLDLVVTGHSLPPEILDQADLVTEMKSLKHPFEKGWLAKKGIDY